MATALLILIYLCFISLGLPDTLFGASWPVIRADLSLPLDTAGAVSLIVTSGTVVSSLLSSRMLKKFGAWAIVTFSVAATALALLGYSFSGSVIFICIFAVPLGLGAGAIDAALNNFVALHYGARHMNWLHCFWGVGAVAGPMIMSMFLSRGSLWRSGYFAVSMIQLTIFAITALSYPLWKRMESADSQDTSGDGEKLVGNVEALKIPGVKYAVSVFFFYCAAEASVGLWSSSFLVEVRDVSTQHAAALSSLFFLGITAGRFISGAIASRISSSLLIRGGICMCFLGILLIILPLHYGVTAAGLLILGLGCAPVYPCMIHETPIRFTRRASQTVIGLQMAVAYTGSALIPPVIGFICAATTIRIFPYFLAISMIMIALCLRKLGRAQESR